MKIHQLAQNLGNARNAAKYMVVNLILVGIVAQRNPEWSTDLREVEGQGSYGVKSLFVTMDIVSYNRKGESCRWTGSPM